jgi:DNA-binding PadR family transcriptional regulator
MTDECIKCGGKLEIFYTSWLPEGAIGLRDRYYECTECGSTERHYGLTKHIIDHEAKRTKFQSLHRKVNTGSAIK